MLTTRITTGDYIEAAKLLVLGTVSWLLPVKWMWPVSRFIGRATIASTSTSPAAKFVSGLLAAYDGSQSAPDIYKHYQHHMRQARLVALALNRPSRRWRANVRWHGLQHLKVALDEGAGAILWVSDFAHCQIVTLMALHQAGFAVYKLSRPEHGFATSPFGVRWFNPLWNRVEKRFIAKRVVILNNDAGPALQLLRERLHRNDVVWITIGLEARRTLQVNFLKGAIRLPTGPLHLARTSRAALLSVFTIRAADGTFDLTIERPLDVDTDITYVGAARAYARSLEAFVTANPEQWSGWETLVVAPSRAS
jgi:lauroyl/myristoyl acyltransferase